MESTNQIKLTMTRIINAPRSLVFKAFTDESMMKAWWGPHLFENTACEMDVRIEGKWKICMHAPAIGFPNHWCYGVFKEIKEPEKIVFTTKAFVDETGHAGIENLNTILLEDLDGKTKLTLLAEVIHADDHLQSAIKGMEQGWSESFEKLNSLISNK
jgi:uncharacterized protein YndB with AHSA1/START domain